MGEESPTGHAAAGEGSAATGASTDGAQVPGAALDDAVLQNSHSFYEWHSELEAARKSKTEEKYRRYAATLEAYVAASQNILTKAR